MKIPYQRFNCSNVDFKTIMPHFSFITVKTSRSRNQYKKKKCKTTNHLFKTHNKVRVLYTDKTFYSKTFLLTSKIYSALSADC